MTPGNNGASTPEDDDPFGYLYADGQANGAQPPSGGYGYPNSVNRVRPVGTRQYGAPQGQPAPQQQGVYGQAPQQQGAHGRPNAHYAAPETFPGGGAPTAPQHSGRGGGGGRRGPNTKGLLIGAVAVVAAVVIGIAVAMTSSGSEDDKGGNEAGGGGTAGPTQSESTEPSPSASEGAEEEAELPSTDAKSLRLSPGVTTASDIEGAETEGGVYVTGFNQVGAKVTWTVDGIEKAGSYRLNVRYGTPGVDADATLLVNGKAEARPLNMKNFGGTPAGDWEKGWKSTWANVNLNEGTNTIELACNADNKCEVVLDQLSITAG
ncbi:MULTISPECIES: CBM35 domain-containing protein [unclassified Streptomyces]|uniref:CBM35 domain-containing protein n=1 Tax=unclassified Streptomyces TaxID=2593676 RepID=UPI00244268DD|nr:CBM35 domain-containing protein [Streptomyces sp. DH41]MDG9726028.1 CBM35 domain-containing protein [Streptomyces sp. DH41]